MRKLLKDYFYFSKKDRNGVLVLAVILVFVFLVYLVVDHFPQNENFDHSEIRNIFEEWKQKNENQQPVQRHFPFDPNTIDGKQLDSLLLPASVKKNLLRYRAAGGKWNHPDDFRKIYGMNDSIFSAIEDYLLIAENHSEENIPEEEKPGGALEMRPQGTFDPNTADSAVLHRFGLNHFQVTTLIRYRESGGKFHSAADIMKIFGIDSAVFLSLKEHIKLKSIPRKDEEGRKPETVFEDGATDAFDMVELNAADTLQLMKLKGIGTVFAGRIVKYRNLLGGFYSKEQLLEVYNFPEETYSGLIHQIYVDTLKIEKLRINFAGYSELLRHPYIQKDHVERILDYRNQNGPFSSLKVIQNEGFFGASFNRVSPYLSCR